MSMEQTRFRTVAVLGVLAAATTLSACAHVGRSEFDAEMAMIRQEITEGDDGVERRMGGRIDDLEARFDRFSADTEAALAELRDEFDMQMERFETALRFNAPIYFEFDQAGIRGEYEGLLSRFSEIVAQYFPTALITVEGFTDAAGSRDYNLRLGQRRADSVKRFLVEQGGLAPERIRAVSYGEDTRRLVVHGQASREQASDNRRVVLVIDHADATAANQVATGSGGGR